MFVANGLLAKHTYGTQTATNEATLFIEAELEIFLTYICYHHMLFKIYMYL